MSKTLKKIPSKGVIFGVCAGIAEHLDMQPNTTRSVLVVAHILGIPWILPYLFMALTPPRSAGEAAVEDPAQQGARPQRPGTREQRCKHPIRTRPPSGPRRPPSAHLATATGVALPHQVVPPEALMRALRYCFAMDWYTPLVVSCTRMGCSVRFFQYQPCLPSKAASKVPSDRCLVAFS